MSNLVVGDADVLVALADEKDANHDKARKVSEWLSMKGYGIIFPNTAILEAITALKRAKNLPRKAHLINRQYQAGAFLIEFVSKEIQQRASLRFEKTVSKKNTIFDAIVAETAVEVGTDCIFSFDGWYSKEGFTLAKVPEE
jgi:predicted nucleic acid-binding protein